MEDPATTSSSERPTSETPPAPPRRRIGVGVVLLACLASGAIGGVVVWLATRDDGGGAPAAAAEKKMWTCPMHPTIVQDHPGECPICGMALVPVDGAAPRSGKDEHAGHEVRGLAEVSIDPARQQLIGLKTAAVEKGQVGATWRTVGRVAVDETRVRHINVKVSGFVERVYVDFVGKPVKKGEALFTIYSPDLVAAQEEYLLALRTRKSLGGDMTAGGDDMVMASRRKLELWDIPRADIARLEQTGQVSKSLALRSPISGVVVKKDVVEGMQLEAGAMPYEIVDLSRVWVLADVYEGELPKVQVGMPAQLTLKAYPLKTFEGEVAFIDPMLDPATRTVKIRLSFANPTGDLRPQMFGEVVLQSQVREALRIPGDAVIHTGTRSVVFVALGEGKFAPREIKVGAGDGQFVEVVEGLAAGEEVVTRANFLVDSESRLRASLQTMGTEPGAPAKPAEPAKSPPPIDHSGHR